MWSINDRWAFWFHARDRRPWAESMEVGQWSQFSFLFSSSSFFVWGGGGHGYSMINWVAETSLLSVASEWTEFLTGSGSRLLCLKYRSLKCLTPRRERCPLFNSLRWFDKMEYWLVRERETGSVTIYPHVVTSCRQCVVVGHMNRTCPVLLFNIFK